MRKKFERFCFTNRNWGIPNLMLYIMIGNGLVYLLTMTGLAPNLLLYLHFDKSLILQGQVWRLFTYVFLSFQKNALLMILFLYVSYSVSRLIEDRWGTLRLNLYYFSGILLTDIYCMITGDSAFLSVQNIFIMSSFVHMSLFMAFATMNPDSSFLMFFIIPVKGWVLVLIDLVLTVYSIYDLNTMIPHIYNLYPLMALLNYVLFFGKDVVNILPLSLQVKLGRGLRKKSQPVQHKNIPFSPAASHGSKAKPAYNHKCTICGRTDVSDPQLEFRYCSRCSGFHCYCEDHISNHTHI